MFLYENKGKIEFFQEKLIQMIYKLRFRWTLDVSDKANPLLNINIKTTKQDKHFRFYILSILMFMYENWNFTGKVTSNDISLEI